MKSCPVCGGMPTLIPGVSDWGFSLYGCRPCRVFGPLGRDETSAAEKWNRKHEAGELEAVDQKKRRRYNGMERLLTLVEVSGGLESDD